jgi:hypothetical protein
MLNMWPILLSWSAIVLMLGLPIIGIVRRQMAWLVVAAIIVSPYSLYLFGTPRFRWIAPVFPVLLLGAGIAIRRSLPWLAWSLFVLFLGFFGWIAVIVLGE